MIQCRWHDHAGESKLFIVVMLSEAGQFGGGQFSYRNLETGEPVELDLGLGDAVVCLSETEHRVCPVLSGVRSSINIDFWSIQEGGDNRSIQDKY